MKRIFRDVIDDDLDLLKQIQFKKYKQKLKEQPILLDWRFFTILASK